MATCPEFRCLTSGVHSNLLSHFWGQVQLISLTNCRSFFGSCSTAARSQSSIQVSPLCTFSCRAALSSERIGSICRLSVTARALEHKSWIRLLGFESIQFRCGPVKVIRGGVPVKTLAQCTRRLRRDCRLSTNKLCTSARRGSRYRISL